jgi:hypothetical protein
LLKIGDVVDVRVNDIDFDAFYGSIIWKTYQTSFV